MATRVVYEATGPYHAGIEKRFAGRLPLCKVNPLQARRFAQSKGTRAKTDAVDARMLAEMGAAFGLVADRPIDQNQRDLKELQVTRLAMVKDRTRLMNRLQTLTLALTKRQTNTRLNQITEQLAALEAEIQARLKACPERAQASEILRSIPGIGAVSAAAILIECPEIGTLTAKQIASLADRKSVV